MRKQKSAPPAWMRTFAFLIILSAGLAQGDWNTEMLDNTDHSGQYTSMALDSNGYPHIVYQHFYIFEGYPQRFLRYAHWDGSEWTIEVVDGEEGVECVGAFCSIAIDGDDLPHISYMSYFRSPDTSGDLKYAHWNGSEWIIETVDTEEYAGFASTIVVDSGNNPHIGYTADPNSMPGELRHAWWNGSSWQIETVDTSTNLIDEVYMAIDSEDHVHFSYFIFYEGDLMYAGWDGGEWQIMPLASEGNVGRNAPIDIDSSDNPHIVFSDETQGIIRYTWWDDTPDTWVEETVWTLEEGNHMDMKLDEDDYPHVSYFCVEDMCIDYLLRDSEGWSTERIDSSYWTGWFTSLDLDSSGNPHVAYLDQNNGALKYAFRPETTVEDVSEAVVLWGTCQLNSLNPNPASSCQTISYQVPEGAYASITVRDLSGRVVNTLVNGVHPFEQNDLVWNTGDLPSGTYIITLMSGDSFSSSKAVICR